ncbi:MAG: YdbH domain-containing protein [Novosphingobium sp.]
MSDPEVEAALDEAELPPPRRKKRWRVLAVLALLIAIAGTVVWIQREKIANSIIAGQIEDLGLPATYEIESIGTDRQVLKNITIGDPGRPDLTVARAEIETIFRLGIPLIGTVRLEGARLYGTYKHGKLSFGSLDPVIFGDRAGPKGLPDLELELVDGRARIDSDYGVIGAKLEGDGNLQTGFRGKLAAVAPALAFAGCKASQTTVYGEVTTAQGRAQFSGPVRLKSLSCPVQQLGVRDATVQLDAELGAKFDSVKGNYALRSGPFAWQGNGTRRIESQGSFAYAGGKLAADYDLVANGVDLGPASANGLTLVGALRSANGSSGIDSEGRIEAQGLSSGKSLSGALASLETSSEGTLLAPLVKQLRTALGREEPGSRFAADYSVRQTGGVTQIMLPIAELHGGSGVRMLGLSRFALSLGLKGGPRFSGKFVTGGNGLPRMAGTAQRTGRGGTEARFSLAEYRAGDSSVALPDLRLVQLAGGQIGFSGRALVSGPLPGGEVRGLSLPVEGNWSESGGLAVWRGCTPIRFERFKVGNLSLNQRTLTLCPGSGGAILRSDRRGTRLAAGTAGLSLAGTLGTTPIRLNSGAVGFAWPGAIAAKSIDVSMGPLDKPSTLKVAEFNGTLGKVVTGHFNGADLKLFPVPLDMSEGAGDLRFANGEVSITGASLKVSDRENPAKFYPLIARDATLELKSTTFTAKAMLREPKSDRAIVEATIVHDLDTEIGFADLLVPGIVFDGLLQPDTLTFAAQGVIALAKGTITGGGRIDWDADNLTSTGSFTTDGLDFAAAFGPAKGARGTVLFSDLLGLVTAPDQRLTIASINPGIEVYDGVLSFQIKPDRLLEVNGAEWPFIDGKMKLLPTRMVLGNAEVRRFTLKVEGANAAKFVQQLELSNISASGTFDGTLPLIFDENGGRIENGILVSRPPGGNLSYVGELTYKDLSAMGNFAFQTLRSLDFQRMEVGLNGDIDGDIVTTMRIEGVRQGKGAKRNFITNQFAGLPIRFNINIRAPFYQLVTSFKSLYDPDYIRDPRSLGLVDNGGNPLPSPVDGPPAQPATLPPVPPRADDIQAPDSRTKP